MLENSVFQNAIGHFVFRNVDFISRSTDNFSKDRIARIARALKSSGATQATQRHSRESRLLVFLQKLSYMSYEKVFYLIKWLNRGKRLLIVLKYKSSSKSAVNAGIPQNFLSNNFCFEWAKES